jgi:aspartate racemase
MIGIVGGMGPYAGLDLFNKILTQTSAQSDQDHLPITMLSAPHTIPDRTDFILGNSDVNPAIAISKIICTLYNQGARVMGMPCNTAHAEPIFSEIIEKIPKEVNLVHMINEVCKFIKIKYPSIKNVGILSTTGTFLSRVYPDCLSQYRLNGIQVSEEIQDNHINPAIYSKNYGIKAQSNPVTENAKKHLNIGVEYLFQNEAEAIILGCTEIPLALTNDQIKSVPLIDATKVLARALILESSPEKLIEDSFA